MRRRRVLLGGAAALALAGLGCHPGDSGEVAGGADSAGAAGGGTDGAGTDGGTGGAGTDSGTGGGSGGTTDSGGTDSGGTDGADSGDTDSGGAADTDSGGAADTAADGSCPPSPPQNSGTFYLEGAPLREVLCDKDRGGEPLSVSGLLLDTDCRPVPSARLEIWHAMPEGGYTEAADGDFRGVLITGDDGSWHFESRVPGYELSETTGDPLPLHVHIKVVAPGAPELITMLYFSDDPVLSSDAYDPPAELIGVVVRDGETARINFQLVIQR